MKYSVSLKFCWPDLPLPERARRAAAHGLDRVDLWDWRGEDIDGLAVACRETGLEIGGFFGHSRGGLADPDQRDEVLAHLVESIEVAERVGAGQLHMFSDEIGPGAVIRKPPPLTWAARFESCVQGLADAAELVRGRDLVLILEAINTVHVPGYFWHEVGVVRMLCERLDDMAVRLSFDCFHQQLVGGRLTDNLIDCLPYAARVDVADVPGRGEPGTGEINYHHIRSVLDECGFDGQITFEIVPRGDSDAALEACMNVFGSP